MYAAETLSLVPIFFGGGLILIRNRHYHTNSKVSVSQRLLITEFSWAESQLSVTFEGLQNLPPLSHEQDSSPSVSCKHLSRLFKPPETSSGPDLRIIPTLCLSEKEDISKCSTAGSHAWFSISTQFDCDVFPKTHITPTRCLKNLLLLLLPRSYQGSLWVEEIFLEGSVLTRDRQRGRYKILILIRAGRTPWYLAVPQPSTRTTT